MSIHLDACVHGFVLSRILDLSVKVPPGLPQFEDERSMKLSQVSVINYLCGHTLLFSLYSTWFFNI